MHIPRFVALGAILGCTLALVLVMASAGSKPGDSSSADTLAKEDQPDAVTLDFPGSTGRTIPTVEEIPADVVVTFTPLREVDEFWPPVQPQIVVWSRWIVRVDDVLLGDAKPGEELMVAVPGGRMDLSSTFSIESGKLKGSMQPQPGRPVTRVQYTNFPPLQVGQSELAFLSSVDNYRSEGVMWLAAVAEARYRVGPGESLVAIASDHPELRPTQGQIESMGMAALRVRLGRTARP